MLVFIKSRTVSYHLEVLTGSHFFLQIKNETKIANKLLILFLFLKFPKNKKFQHPNPEFGHLGEIQKKTCKKRTLAFRGGLKLTKLSFILSSPFPKCLHCCYIHFHCS